MILSAGILCHVSSLPTRFGIGDFGPMAYEWIDKLSDAQQTYWQMLPIGNTNDSGCPYSTDSAFGCAEFYISPELLQEKFNLDQSIINDVYKTKNQDSNRVSFIEARTSKRLILEKAFSFFKPDENFEIFLKQEEYWINDYAEFRAKEENNPQAFSLHLFIQYVAFNQLHELHSYARSKGVKLVGDLPIFISFRSMDVWKHPQDFYLTKTGELEFETGAAPDAFSETGQKWGTPIYDWDSQKENNFLWWQERLSFLSRYFDTLRIDHFRGFCATWISKVTDIDASQGYWYPGPGRELFLSLKNKPELFAEDLGYITPDVIALRDEFNLPSMKVLQFMSADDDNPHKPSHYKGHCVAYTGTHDNETLVGWWNQSSIEEKTLRSHLLNIEKNPSEITHWDLINSLLQSKAAIAIVPIQDFLGLDNSARFNVPGTVMDLNWTWKLSLNDFNNIDWKTILEMTVSGKRGFQENTNLESGVQQK